MFILQSWISAGPPCTPSVVERKIRRQKNMQIRNDFGAVSLEITFGCAEEGDGGSSLPVKLEMTANRRGQG